MNARWRILEEKQMPRMVVADVLGGRRALNRQISKFEDLQEAIRTGLPFATLEAVIQKLDLGLNEAAAILSIPERTMARRKRDRKLPPDESDRVLRLARVYAHATEVFETEDDARDWLKDPNRALGRKRPLDLLDTDIGVQKVDALLTRIQHGVYS
jgi:putative toxin-antitoxin system antitoxin component (TIGR02293 family)